MQKDNSKQHIQTTGKYLNLLQDLYSRGNSNYNLTEIIKQHRLSRDTAFVLKKLGILTINKKNKIYHMGEPDYTFAKYVAQAVYDHKKNQVTNQYEAMLEQANKRYNGSVLYKKLDEDGNVLENCTCIPITPAKHLKLDIITIDNNIVHAKGKWAPIVKVNNSIQKPEVKERPTLIQRIKSIFK